jgi:hypothetical protein
MSPSWATLRRKRRVRSCTGWSSNRPSGPLLDDNPIIREGDPGCDLARIQHLVGHDDHPHSGLCHAANGRAAPRLPGQTFPRCCDPQKSSAAKCVPPDKPALRKTDGHAAAAPVFAELINVRATGAGCAQQHAPSAKQSDTIAGRPDRCRVCGNTEVIVRFWRRRSAIRVLRWRFWRLKYPNP